LTSDNSSVDDAAVQHTDPVRDTTARKPRDLPAERVVVGVTGASGSLYAELLIRRLLGAGVRTYVVFTGTGAKVVATELRTGLLPALARCERRVRLEELPELQSAASAVGLAPEQLSELRLFPNEDLYAPIASGSEGATHMAVCPMSMGTLARIAHGISGCLVERAADVMLKERRPLVVVPRETPLSLIHLQNMVTLTQAGAHIVPAMPAFYMNPTSIDDLGWFVVERVCDALRIPRLAEFKGVRWNVRNL